MGNILEKQKIVNVGEVYWFDRDWYGDGHNDTFIGPGNKAQHSGLMSKSRPWVVVQVYGITCSIVPLTSSDKYELTDANSVYLNNTRENWDTLPKDIKCSHALVIHITTVDVNVLGDYFGTLSKSAMLKIKACLGENLGISIPDADSMYAFFEEIFRVRYEELKAKILKEHEEVHKTMIDNFVDNIKLKFEELPNITNNSKKSSDIKEYNQEIVKPKVVSEEKTEVATNETNAIESNSDIVIKRLNNKHWNVSLAQSFLKDYKELGTCEKLAEMYSLPIHKLYIQKQKCLDILSRQ